MRLPAGMSWLLWPASLVFEVIVRLRGWCYRRGVFKQRRLRGVVISVGNLTVGGTGKTPMVLWIAERLIAEGKPVGILTRGYRGGRPAGERGKLESDEAAMLRERLRRKARFGIGADRYRKGLMLERHGVEWFVLDDGFQHLRLARDADIVLIDATDPFGGGFLLPAGRLREPKSSLSRADIVVVTRSEHAPAVETVIRRHTTAPVFHAQTQLDSVCANLESLPGGPPLPWRAEKFFAFCGIGNPAAFYDDLQRWGMQIVGTADYRDHHHYSQGDADDLERRAQATGATALLCTEKDVWNLDGVQFRRIPVFFCRIDLRIAEGEQFWQAVSEVVQTKRARVAR